MAVLMDASVSSLIAAVTTVIRPTYTQRRDADEQGIDLHRRRRQVAEPRPKALRRRYQQASTNIWTDDR
jgi:hypothetical protein